jgi:DNA-directed RNA polymerase specialized sigma24 family protein
MLGSGCTRDVEFAVGDDVRRVSAVPRASVEQFDDWVLPHLSTLSAVAARYVGRNDGPDVVQNALLRAWRKWDTYSPSVAPHGRG